MLTSGFTQDMNSSPPRPVFKSWWRSRFTLHRHLHDQIHALWTRERLCDTFHFLSAVIFAACSSLWAVRSITPCNLGIYTCSLSYITSNTVQSTPKRYHCFFVPSWRLAHFCCWLARVTLSGKAARVIKQRQGVTVSSERQHGRISRRKRFCCQCSHRQIPLCFGPWSCLPGGRVNVRLLGSGKFAS